MSVKILCANRSAMFIVTSLSTHAMSVENQIFLVKMKAPCLLILIAIQLSSKLSNVEKCAFFKKVSFLK